MKLGILTFHRAFNCGAMLQAWALKTVLERMGHSVEFPSCNSVGNTKRFMPVWVEGTLSLFKRCCSLVYRILYNSLSFPGEDIKRWRFQRFKKNFLPERDCMPQDFSKYYDGIVVGSDQVWSDRHSNEEASLFFGNAIPKDLPKITYAASYGDLPLTDERLARVIDAAKRFQAVSAREQLVKDQIEVASGKDVQVVLDPTLLLTADEYAPLLEEFKPPRKPYLFMYTLRTSPFYVETAKKVAKALGVDAIIAPMYQYSRLFAPSGLMYGISPERMVGYIANATYVLAGSFHGTAFATIFNKPFLSLRENLENPDALSRPGTLLKLTGNLNRIVTPETSIEEMVELLKTPPVQNGEIDVARQQSLAWLEQALMSLL